MKIPFLHLVGISYCLLWLVPKMLHAQEPLQFRSMEQAFAVGMELLNSFKNDSANIIFTGLIEELTVAQELETNFGFKVRLRQAEALEKDDQDEAALQKLLVLADESAKKEYWDVYVNANLSLARLQEKLDRAEVCLTYLRNAAIHIEQYQLDTIYPRLYNRMASYHRIFNSKDSALYYAQEAIRTATQFGQEEEAAVGYLLTGLVWRDTVPDKSIQPFKIAGKRWKRVGDYSGYGGILTNLSKVYLKKQMLELALHYSDSALVAFHLAAFKGHESRHVFYYSYKHRAEIFKAFGQLDSALYYTSLGYEIQLEETQISNQDKIVEIEERYKDEKKEAQIKKQFATIQYERSRRNMLMGLCFVTLFFATVLAYYYLKLRAVNEKFIDQAAIITKANEGLSTSLEHQIMLQGEIHHRVKNNLQIIISLLELQQEEVQDEVALKQLEGMSNRIYSMAAIHEMLYQKQGTGLVNFSEYVQNLYHHFNTLNEQNSSSTCDLDIREQRFNLTTLMPLGIILSELFTNSFKYAISKDRQLKIEVRLAQKKDGYCLHYKDNGAGFPKGELQERKGGLGTYLLKSMTRQLHGTLESKNDKGAKYEIFFKEKNREKYHG